MKIVKFIGPMAVPAKSTRILYPADLERLGVDYPHGSMEFGPKTHHQIEMSNDASESLVAALPQEFTIVSEDDDDGEELPLPLTNLNPQSNSGSTDNDQKPADDESSEDD